MNSENDDPLNSSDPAVRQAEIDSNMRFMLEEIRKDKDAQIDQTRRALLARESQQAPQSFGNGAINGDLMSL